MPLTQEVPTAGLAFGVETVSAHNGKDAHFMSASSGQLGQLIDAYCAAWNEDDPSQRAAMLELLCVSEVVYVDPRRRTRGIEELCAFIGEVRAQRSGARVVRTSAIDVHHDILRFAWQVVLADGTRRPESLDVCDVTDGRLSRIVGFFGALERRREQDT